MSPEELVALTTSLAIAIAKDKSMDEINMLAAVFSQVSTTLATISVQRDILEKCAEKEQEAQNKSNKDANKDTNNGAAARDNIEPIITPITPILTV